MPESSGAAARIAPIAFVPLAGQLRIRLKELRDARGWTLRDLEGETGITRSVLGRYETLPEPNPTLAHLVELQRAFGLGSLEEFFGKVEVSVSFPTGSAVEGLRSAEG